MRYRESFRPSRPREAVGGIKAQSRAGDFGKSWWARRWQSVLDSFHLGGRLARGRNYARAGQVLNIEVLPGTVRARVQGSRPRPYDVRIGVTVLSDRQWAHLVEVLSGQALFVAKLLAGEMPQDIEEVFRKARLSLFPAKRGDLKTNCSCPDEANPCKHIAAVYYLLGEEFDRDPFLLFRMRGLGREELLAKLGRGPGPAPARAQAHTQAQVQVQAQEKKEDPRPAPVPAEPLPAEAAFWALGTWHDEQFGEVAQPPVSAGWVRRLGKFPFWRGERPLADALEAAYVQGSQMGLNSFLGEREKG